ncbi:hypothetical protein [Streptomyces sp. NPDC059743]|uniref:hypothetical protein n=1 Tax=Streptomyces sp. NPDC059743 TaxID=3346928 RepID=UPI00365E6385
MDSPGAVAAQSEGLRWVDAQEYEHPPGPYEDLMAALRERPAARPPSPHNAEEWRERLARALTPLLEAPPGQALFGQAPSSPQAVAVRRPGAIRATYSTSEAASPTAQP